MENHNKIMRREVEGDIYPSKDRRTI